MQSVGMSGFVCSKAAAARQGRRSVIIQPGRPWTHFTSGKLRNQSHVEVFGPKDEAGTVELLELLYNVPPLYHLNLSEFPKRRQQIKHHYDFFSPLHGETALLPMTFSNG